MEVEEQKENAMEVNGAELSTVLPTRKLNQI